MSKTAPNLVHIVDDDAADTKHLQSILSTSGYEVQATDDCESFLTKVDTLPASIVLLDLRMPGVGGLEVLRRLSTTRPDIPVVMVSGRGDIRSAVKAIKAGASDFLEKPVDPEELIDVVKRAATRQCLGSPGTRGARPVDVWSKISRREAEVLERLLKGQRNKQAAHDMKIAERTVETHRANMMKRLGVNSFADLVRMAIASGERPKT
jgi:two-component system response regulator FixJ